MTDQAKIDKICEWMGLAKRWNPVRGRETWWKNGSPFRDDFDPFTSPADCAVVMDEVQKQKYNYGTHYDAETQRDNKHSAWIEKAGENSDMYSGTTECEAKMNAVLAMIEAK